ncbi:hypothetical protein Rhe02_02280 [Rhizocola hellebori]|uniref:LPXTG cell wall anchor domain-containing protein n=1 Tax=Rhizocola hellebori TaxID=1392758 RepID=A0A8J3Q200_9ACTN|nr:hypothetical protein [Rhizocola hellebori]GIH02161.1 hypothetical protein Rhe02_02280 [Rhizocola hellebori]
MMMRRLAAVLLSGLVATTWWAAPVSADNSLGVGNPGQSSIYVLVPSAINVTTFSGSGPAVGPDLRLDLSGLSSAITVLPEGTGCDRSGQVVACSQLTQVRIEVAPGTGPGQAGKIVVRNESSSASITVDVLTGAQSTLVGDNVTVTGRIGDVVSIPLSVHNQGPNTLYRGGFNGFSYEDNTHLVSMDGCRPGPPECYRDNFRAGTSLDLTLHVRIDGCTLPGASGGYGLFGTPVGKFTMGRFKIKVTGCPGSGTSGGGTSGGSTQSNPVTATSVTPEAVPPASPTAEPSTTVTASPTDGALAAPLEPAATDRPLSSTWPLLATGAAIVLIGAGLFGALAYRRRSKPAAPAAES